MAIISPCCTIFLTENPLVQVAADFSNWCTVAESLLQDQEAAVRTACERAYHIHARVGYEQSPQVNETRTPEWEKHLHTRLQWWKIIIENRSNEGQETLTITTEFGSLPYMPTLPYSKQPISNQWDINLFMMQLLKKQYQ